MIEVKVNNFMVTNRVYLRITKEFYRVVIKLVT